jgi:hypothetical protein
MSEQEDMIDRKKATEAARRLTTPNHPSGTAGVIVDAVAVARALLATEERTKAARREGMEEAARIATQRATDIRGRLTRSKYDEETVYTLTACADELDIIAAAICRAAQEE